MLERWWKLASYTDSSSDKKVLLHGQIIQEKNGLGYWLFTKTGKVQEPPLFLDVVAPGNDTNIDPLFWIVDEVEYSPKHRTNIPQFIGGGDIGWSNRQAELKRRHII